MTHPPREMNKQIRNRYLLIGNRMDTKYHSLVSVSILFFCASLVACTPSASPTPYIPPSPVFRLLPSSTPAFDLPAFTPTPCFNDLALVEDLTIPDNTVVLPGSSLEKKWLVRNAGTCDWTGTYSLRFIGGSQMAAIPEQPLSQARSGQEATIRILFTAPLEPGQYVSLWQALDLDGIAFGEIFQVTVVVQP